MIHIYAILFLVGVLGLLAQTLLGVAGSHGGHMPDSRVRHGAMPTGTRPRGHAHGRATRTRRRARAAAAAPANCC